MVEFNYEIAKMVKKYYGREDIIRAMFEFSADREVVPVIRGERYAKRPSMVKYLTDLKVAVANSSTSFHCSVERWKDVMALENAKGKADIDEIRKGWDFIIDIDSKRGIEEAKVVGMEIVKFLKSRNITNIYVKFSGRRGFHIAVNGNALPAEVRGERIEMLYPALLQKLIKYIKEEIKEKVEKEFISQGILKEGESMEKVVEVEENWSVRHLFRMPYSFNEKTWLISLPIEPSKLSEFNMEMAKPESVEEVGEEEIFLKKYKNEELKPLIEDMFRKEEKQRQEEELKKKLELMRKGYDMEQADIEMRMQEEYDFSRIKVSQAQKRYTHIGKEFFPPCIIKMLDGLQDGRKRALFVLINFLRKCKWEWEDIEREIEEWNKKNHEPLRDSYIQSQIKYFKKNEEKLKDIPPPNCSNTMYYKDIGVCNEEECKNIKNPLSYAIKRHIVSKKKIKKKKTRGSS